MSIVAEGPMATNADLTELIALGGTADKKIGVLIGHNLGSNTLLVKVPMHEFFEISEVANERGLAARPDTEEQGVAQRPLDTKHAQKLAVYLLKGLAHALASRYRNDGKPVPPQLEEIQRHLGAQPYLAMQPITANIRSCEFGGKGLRVEQGQDGVVFVYLASKDVLWVVDGQHRRFAMQMLFEYLRTIITTHKFPKRPPLYPVVHDGTLTPDHLRVWMTLYEVARTYCTVMVEVHLGLDVEKEKQLFHDLNNLGKKVESSLAFSFDQSNPVNKWIKDELIDKRLLDAQIVEQDVKDFQEDKGYIARKDVVAVNAILFLNKTNVTGAKPQDVDQKLDYGRAFWEAVNAIDGFGEDGAKQKTVAAQPVVLKALAKLAYDFGFGRHKKEEWLSALLDGIPTLNFAHDEPMWRYYQLSPDERKKWKLDGLAEYLPPEEGGNRDIGAYNEKDRAMRFGAKHNDIYPILGDMIRWRLRLPSRKQADAIVYEEGLKDL